MADMVRAVADSRFLVCIKKTADFGGIPKKIIAQKRYVKSGGNFIHILSKLYLALARTLLLAKSNKAVRLGISQPSLRKGFLVEGGLGFNFESSRKTMSFG